MTIWIKFDPATLAAVNRLSNILEAQQTEALTTAYEKLKENNDRAEAAIAKAGKGAH